VDHFVTKVSTGLSAGMFAFTELGDGPMQGQVNSALTDRAVLACEEVNSMSHKWE
jgi:hypothetical protein